MKNFYLCISLWLITACEEDPMATARRPDPNAVNVMHAFQTPDLTQWNHLGIIAYGAASLGLAIDREGALLITCIQEVRPPTWWEQKTDPPVRGYRFDGETWEPKAWAVDDNGSRSYIDPQMFEGKMWYITPKSSVGDPAQQRTKIEVRSSNPGIVHLSGQRLADPSPARFNNEFHLFLTENMRIKHLKGTPLQAVQPPIGTQNILNFATVPFAITIADELWLLGQQNVQGRRLPVITKSKDGSTWAKWEPIGDIPRTLKNCTSPVLGPHPKGGWLLLCIEELLR